MQSQASKFRLTGMRLDWNSEGNRRTVRARGDSLPREVREDQALGFRSVVERQPFDNGVLLAFRGPNGGNPEAESRGGCAPSPPPEHVQRRGTAHKWRQPPHLP